MAESNNENKNKKEEVEEIIAEEIDKNTIIKKEGFFKKVWKSIVKIEKYPEMAAEGFGRAMTYLSQLIAIVAIVICSFVIYKTNNMVQEGVNYLESQFPEFSYKDGILNVEKEEPITIESEDNPIQKVIIDTKVEDQNEINKYTNEINNSKDGIVVLKDKIILKDQMVKGNIIYNYKDSVEPLGIKEFNKQDVINYARSPKIINMYISVFLTFFMFTFMMYFFTTISYVLLISAFGFLSTILSRIKLRYVAIFNMSVYAITLSTILNLIYFGVNMFIPFEIKYFEPMYVTVAFIYLIAAILILKTEFIKKQMELIRIAQIGKLEDEETKEEEEQEEKNQKEKEERKEKDTKEEKENKEKSKKNSNDQNGDIAGLKA